MDDVMCLCTTLLLLTFIKKYEKHWGVDVGVPSTGEQPHCFLIQRRNSHNQDWSQSHLQRSRKHTSQSSIWSKVHSSTNPMAGQYTLWISRWSCRMRFSTPLWMIFMLGACRSITRLCPPSVIQWQTLLDRHWKCRCRKWIRLPTRH